MSPCSVCKKIDKLYSCDKCKQLFCDACSSLTSSEIRCLELKKRVLQFHCKSCLSRNDQAALNASMEIALKSMMEEALKDLNAAFETFKTDFLTMASQKLSSLSVVSQPPAVDNTYAGIVSKSTRQSVIIKPKNGNQANSKTKLDLVAGINPVGSQIKINTVKHIRNGGLVVGCSGAEDADKFVELAGEKLSANYDVHRLKRILPRIRVTGISEKLAPDTLREYILGQNEDSFCGADCKILKISSVKNRADIYQAAVQLDTVSYSRVLKAGYLIIGFDVCKVYDAVDLIRCYKCNGFNHTSQSCKRGISCPRCGAGHDVKECTVEEAQLCCVNCLRTNEKLGKSFDTNHAVWNSQACSVYKESVEKFKSDLFGTP